MAATFAATRDATRAATDDATRAATDDATRAATSELRKFVAVCAARWSSVYQGGSMWSGACAYYAAMRDVIGLRLPEFEKYQAWEDCARHGGFRVLHEEFCIVSDFPEFIRIDDQNRPHCETGASHRWRDGWSLYHWHGTSVPREWIEDRASLTPEIALRWENVEQRRAACEILGWSNVLEHPSLNPRVIDEDEPHIGTLVEVDLPDAPQQWFLKYRCGTGRWFAESVNDKSFDTALKANAGGNGWRGQGDPMSFIPFIRT